MITIYVGEGINSQTSHNCFCRIFTLCNIKGCKKIFETFQDNLCFFKSLYIAVYFFGKNMRFYGVL